MGTTCPASCQVHRPAAAGGNRFHRRYFQLRWTLKSQGPVQETGQAEGWYGDAVGAKGPSLMRKDVHWTPLHFIANVLRNEKGPDASRNTLLAPRLRADPEMGEPQTESEALSAFTLSTSIP